MTSKPTPLFSYLVYRLYETAKITTERLSLSVITSQAAQGRSTTPEKLKFSPKNTTLWQATTTNYELTLVSGLHTGKGRPIS